jgi:prophage regulatory protein
MTATEILERERERKRRKRERREQHASLRRVRRVLRLKEVTRRTGRSRSSLYDDIAANTFPGPIPLGPRAVGWLEEEIEDWLDARIAERDDATMRRQRAVQPEQSAGSVQCNRSKAPAAGWSAARLRAAGWRRAMRVEHRAINSIVVGERIRADLGDIEGLAESMRERLLHPITITDDGKLLAGARRLAAALLLGWTTILVCIVEDASCS